MPLPIGLESWIWYSFAMLVVTIRFISRFVQLESLRRLQLEDYLMILAACLYTILIVLLNIVSEVQTNLIAPGDLPNLTPENIAGRVRGSKMVLGLEACMCCVIWLCKSCILLLYYKLTFGLTQHIMVKLTGVYVVCSFIVMMTLYFAVWCRPFSGYWQTPSNNVQCTTATNHLITNFVFNLSSDLLILSIPLPLLLRSALPFAKKAALIALFSLGLFIMVCTILSKYYSFRQPFSPIWVFWYTREASTAMLVTNMTHVWTLVRRMFHLKSFTGDSSTGGSARRAGQYPAEMATEGDGGQGMTDARSQRLSIPFADIGGLLPPRSSVSKTNSCSSLGRLQPKWRFSPSVVTSPTHTRHPSWLLGIAAQAYEEAMDRVANRNSTLPTGRQESALEAPSLSDTDIQILRNPASAYANSLPRGLRRVDSITLLGLPVPA